MLQAAANRASHMYLDLVMKNIETLSTMKTLNILQINVSKSYCISTISSMNNSLLHLTLNLVFMQRSQKNDYVYIVINIFVISEQTSAQPEHI